MGKSTLTSALVCAFLLLFGATATAGVEDDGPQQSTTGPVPPLAVVAEDMARIFEGPVQGGALHTITGVPDYSWRHGCGPTAVGMVVGYYDTQGYNDLIPGDANTQTASVNQAIASGGTSGSPNPPGSELHYEDYARPEDSWPTLQQDDYITASRTPHPNDSIADYMDTSKSTRSNYYGWSWSSDVSPAFTGYVNQQNTTYAPSCTEYRWSTGALTWAVLTNEIDNGRPMVFLVDSDGDGSTDHFVTIVGYDDSTPKRYGCHDTWAPTGVRWEQFRGMSSSYSWGIWGGWTFSLAGWNPSRVVKWEQLPDDSTNGIDIRCDRSDGINRILADDFNCTTTGPITEVTFWGSWKDDIKGQIQTIHLSIHSNDPCGPSGWSEPNELLWERDFTAGDFNETLYSDLEPEWFWDPTTGLQALEYNHYGIWQYDISIDSNNAFVQQGDPCNPVTYWLDVWVSLMPDPCNPEFGWKTSSEQWQDDAVYWDDTLMKWQEMRYPPGHDLNPDSLDMSFRIVTGTEAEPNQPVSKWEQLPDLTTTGIDVNATKPMILADDYNCTTTGNITQIVIWGSWLNDYLPYDDANNVRFTLSIHSDIPDDPNNSDDWSTPGNVLWQRVFQPGVGFSAEIEAQNIEEGWLDPPDQNYTFPADSVCWKYTFTIDPCEAFYQTGTVYDPCVYWLDVQAEPLDTISRFGWKTSLEHWNDDAVWGQGTEPFTGSWYELRYPPAHELYGDSIDLAFAIYTTEANEPNEPTVKPLMAHTKWSQPPIEVDPNSDIPTYCGWDEKSYKTYQAQDPNWHIVADDFRCLSTMPVTSIHWWGSFFDWESWASGTLPPVLPDAWRICFWNNVRKGTLPYSHPEVVLHDITVPASRVTIEEVGSDEYFGYYPYDLCYQFNVELEPNEVFWQNDYNDVTQDGIYWISIVALYQSDYYPDHPWGWKTRPWSWMDDAVKFETSIDPVAGTAIDPTTMTPLEDPVYHESFDVSFELDTDPNYIKWEQLYTGIRHWPHYEDVNSTFKIDDPQNEHLVADDWRCLTQRPVTAIVWWGSYIGYGYEACSTGPFMPLPIPPDKFRLSIWTDVPAGSDPCYTYSHPDAVIWSYDAVDYDEVLVGYDKYPHGAPNEPVFRYSVKLPTENVFIQRDYNDVFWLSVQAVYEVNQPNYVWGWTNHEHVFNDDAVQGYWDAGLWKWVELYDQTGASEDMSFMLFTDPNDCYTGPDYVEWVNVGKPNSWCHPKQCHGDATGSDEQFGRGTWVSVGFQDFQVLLGGYNDPVYVNPTVDPWIAADFTHSQEQFGRGIYVHVGFQDFQILLAYYNDPCSTVPGDCLTGSPVSP